MKQQILGRTIEVHVKRYSDLKVDEYPIHRIGSTLNYNGIIKPVSHLKNTKRVYR